MNLLVQSLIQGVVGFAIGAGTNDLAIRWVFRAIFAKKKPQIASAVQRVVSHELMTPEKIAARLAAPEVVAAIEADFSSLIGELCAKEYPTLDECVAEAGDRAALDAAEDGLAACLADAAFGYLSSDAFREGSLRGLAAGVWEACAAETPDELLGDRGAPGGGARALGGGGGLWDALPRRIARELLAEPRRAALCDAIAGGLVVAMERCPTPFALLGMANARALTGLLTSRTPFIVDEMAVLMASPDAQKILREALRGAVRRRLGIQGGAVGSLLGGLMSLGPVEEQLDKFCATLPGALREQFAVPQESAKMRRMIAEACGRLFAKPWGELVDLGGEPRRKLRGLVEGLLGDAGIRVLLAQAVESWGSSVLDELRREPVGRIAGRFIGTGKLQPWIDSASAALGKAMTAPAMKARLGEEAKAFIHRLRGRPIGRPGRFLPPLARQRAARLLTVQLTAFVQTHTADLLEQTRIWDVIYNSITVYDARKMEEVTRSVANRELWGVTLMGGVIGFLVGIAQGVLLWLWDKL